MQTRSMIVLITLLSVVACKKENKSNKPLLSTNDLQRSSSILPPNAEITSLSLHYGSFYEGYKSYQFDPAGLLLKGRWDTRSTSDGAKTESAQVAIEEIEWLLVKTNINMLKPLKLDDENCGLISDGSESGINVSYKVADSSEAKSVTLIPLASKNYRCGDHYIADENFQLILKAVQDKLPDPTL